MSLAYSDRAIFSSPEFIHVVTFPQITNCLDFQIHTPVLLNVTHVGDILFYASFRHNSTHKVMKLSSLTLLAGQMASKHAVMFGDLQQLQESPHVAHHVQHGSPSFPQHDAGPQTPLC